MTDRQFFVGFCVVPCVAAAALILAPIGVALTSPVSTATAAPAPAPVATPVAVAPSAQYDGSVDHRVRCELTVKNGLKDPDSFKRLDWLDGVPNGILRYTATNGFGGRVQEAFDCKLLTYQ